MHGLLEKAAGEAANVIRGVGPDEFGLPTPCADYDVRGLINHLIRVAAVSELAARKSPLPTDGSMSPDRDYIGADAPADALERQVDAAMAAWSEPAAWDGTTRLGNAGEMPPRMAAAMLLVDLVAHGWDIARATGQEIHCDEDVAEGVRDAVEQIGEPARKFGAYAEPVPVPEDGSPIDRAVAATGRDPHWSPPGR